MHLNKPIVAMAVTPDGKGYRADLHQMEEVFAFGDAHYHGSPSSNPIPDPIVGIARTANGDGYWIRGIRRPRLFLWQRRRCHRYRADQQPSRRHRWHG